MLESTIRYADASREFMGKAWDYLAIEDLPQASEKGWGAAAEMVKAVAEERGWPHRSHRLLFDIIDDLVTETGDTELSALFERVNVLHINFYENWMRAAAIRRTLYAVTALLGKLEPMLSE